MSLATDYMVGNGKGHIDGEPYIVRFLGNNYIPINVLVYAMSTEDAQERVVNSIRNAANTGTEYNRPVQILQDLDSGKLEIECEPFDKSTIIKVGWACNDTIF